MKNRLAARAGSLAGRLAGLLAQYEKILLAILSVVIVISGTFWYRQFAGSQADGPTIGGTYVDGIVGNEKDVQSIASKLTKTGLFTFDDEGNLKNQLVTKWEANPDKTIYSFQVDPDVDEKELQAAILDNLDLIGNASVEVLEGKTLTIQLDQPNPDLPLLLAQPLFDYGPYKVSKMTSKTTVFTRNTRSKAATAYINKIIVHSFADDASLREAFKAKKLDGGALTDTNELPGNYELKEVSLPQYYSLVLNVNRAPFREVASRTALLSGSFTKAFTLTVPDEEPYKSLAATLLDQWKARGIVPTVEYKPLSEVTDKISPSRDFQALITGIDYGAELDPYYLWHSSQVRPPENNISGLKSDKIDTQLAQIQTEYNPIRRKELVNNLHASLQQEGVLQVLRQEEMKFVLAKDVTFNEPWLPLGPKDRWQAVARWSVQ